MARTPLARWLRRIVREERKARELGIEVAALRDAKAARVVRAPLPSRRRFLHGLGAAFSGLALNKAGVARARLDDRVAIVGGGIAGLSCALELADHGVFADVYEASTRFGGRMFSNTQHWGGQQVSEWCGELIDSGHETIQTLAARFGLTLDDLHAAEPENATDTYFFGGSYYSASDAEHDFREIYPAIQADVEAAGYPTSFDAFTRAGAALDRTSVYDYIELRVPGGHDAPLGQLLDNAYAGEYAADTTDQSALNLLYLLGFQPDEERGLSLFGESDEAFHIRGGNEQLPRAMAASLPSQTLHTGQRLVRIERTAGGRARLHFAQSSGSTREVVADHVVLALPFAVLREVDLRYADFDPRKLLAIRQLGRGVVSKLQLQFRERVWNRPGPWGLSNGSSYADTGYAGGWEATRAQPGRAGILVNFAGGHAASTRGSDAYATELRQSVREDASATLRGLEQVFPGLSRQYAARATQSIPHRSELIRSAYAYYRVGQYTAFGGYERARQGNVYFAGEHTSQDFQGYMEGGAAEGQRAARQVLRRSGGR